MKKWGKVLGVVVLLTVGIAVAAEVVQNTGPSGTWRYKITVNVETPEGIKTGSAVREVKGTVNIKPLPEEKGAGFRVLGEAVVVDFGDGREVFALMPGDAEEVFKAFPPKTNTWPELIGYYDHLEVGTKGTLPEKFWPTFVAFQGLEEPQNLILARGRIFDVEKQESILMDNFKTIFGDGVYVKDIMLEITDEPVTSDIVDKYLSQDFWKKFEEWWKKIDIQQKTEKQNLFQFKQGELK